MLNRIVIAVLIGAIVGLACLLGGSLLASLGIPPATAVGGFLERWAWVIGTLAGLWHFFAGGGLPGIP